MTRNEHAVINTLRNPVSTDVQCMHYRDTAALRKYSALACYRPDHNGQSVRFGYYPPDTRRFTVKIRPSIPTVYVILSIERCSTYPLSSSANEFRKFLSIESFRSIDAKQRRDTISRILGVIRKREWIRVKNPWFNDSSFPSRIFPIETKQRRRVIRCTHIARGRFERGVFFSLTSNVDLIAFPRPEHCPPAGKNDFSAGQYFDSDLNANEMERSRPFVAFYQDVSLIPRTLFFFHYFFFFFFFLSR